jgi:transposase InsO family protein
MMSCRKIPKPTSLKQLQSLLGLFNYLRDYIPRFAEIAFPLERLKCSKNISADWNNKHDEAFSKLCATLESLIFIHHPRLDLPLCVATDASKVGIGGILYQEEGDNTLYIRITSRALSKSEINYSAVKRELLSIVHCLTTFHIYIWGQLFTLFTDSRILTYLFTQKDLSPLLLGWLEIILDYTFEIRHLPGIMNLLPDCISRLWPEISLNTLPESFCAFIAQIDVDLLSMPTEDQRIILLERAHLLGHFGTKAIIDSIRKKYQLWPGITSQANKLVLSCIDCQRFSVKSQGFHPLTSLDATLPWDHMAIDLAGPFEKSFDGMVYILVIVCVATRFVILRPIADKSALSVALELFTLFCLVGFPKIMQSDNGTEFVNQVIHHLVLTATIDHRLILPYHPRPNGIVERPIGTMKKVLYKMLNGFLKNWDRFVPSVQYAMNVKVHPIHDSKPFALFFARSNNEFLDFTESSSKLISPEQMIARVEFINAVVHPEIVLRKKALIDKRKSDFEKTHKIIKRGAYTIGSDVMFLDTSIKYNAPGHVPRWARAVVVGYGKFGSYCLANLDGSLLPRNTPPSQVKPFLDPKRNKSVFTSLEFKTILNHSLNDNIELKQAKSSDFHYLVLWNRPETSPLSNDLSAIRSYWKRRQDVLSPVDILGEDNVVFGIQTNNEGQRQSDKISQSQRPSLGITSLGNLSETEAETELEQAGKIQCVNTESAPESETIPNEKDITVVPKRVRFKLVFKGQKLDSEN